MSLAILKFVIPECSYVHFTESNIKRKFRLSLIIISKIVLNFEIIIDCC